MVSRVVILVPGGFQDFGQRDGVQHLNGHQNPRQHNVCAVGTVALAQTTSIRCTTKQILTEYNDITMTIVLVLLLPYNKLCCRNITRR